MTVKIKVLVSESQVVKYGVPQGSVLLFNVYRVPLTVLISNTVYHIRSSHMIHSCMLIVTKRIHPLHHATLCVCINDIKEWLSSNFLLNDKKTELIKYTSDGLKQNHYLVIGNTPIDNESCAKNLGCVLDVGLVMLGDADCMC